MSAWPREAAARLLVEHAAEIPVYGTAESETQRILDDRGHALYVWRRARSHVHPLWTGDGYDPADPWHTSSPDYDAVLAAGRLLELEDEP